MNDDLFHAATIRTLAEIDTALGLPDDGCNSPLRTLQAIRRIKSAHEQVAHWTDQFLRATKRAESANAENEALRSMLRECIGYVRHDLAVASLTRNETAASLLARIYAALGGAK